MENFEGKIALVTGGARGLGEAICRNLVEAGATVIMVDIQADLLDKSASQLEASGHKVQPMVVDVCDELQVEKAIKKIAAGGDRDP